MSASNRQRLCVAVFLLTCLLAALPVVADDDMAIRSHAVRVEIDGLVAVTTVEQTYVNYGDLASEAILRFRLPPGAAGHELALWVDGLRCPAAMHPRVAARRIYREIVDSSRDPALLEYLGSDRWQLSVFPVPAEGTQKVQIRYSQLLPVVDGRIVYDGMVVSSGSTVLKVQDLDFSVKIRCPGGVKDFHAASNAMGVQRDGEAFVAGFRAEQASLVKPITFAFTPGEAPPAVAVYRPAKGAPIFAAMLPAVDVPAVAKSRLRNVVMILDASASMSKDEYRLAEIALGELLWGLKPNEKFAVVSVGSDVSLWKEKLVPASKANVRAAADWLSLIVPKGGTDLAAAFRAVESLNTDKAAPLHAFIFTDGNDSVCVREAAGPRRAKRLRRPPPNCRVYAYVTSWGADTMIETLASATGGLVDGGLELEEGDVESGMGRLLAASTDASSAELDLTIDRGAGSDGGLDQAGHSGLATDRRCVVAGRIDGDRPWRATTKIIAAGKAYTKTLTLPVSAPSEDGPRWAGPALEKVWAHLKAEQQWRAMQHRDVRLAALRSLVEFSRTHRVVTRATAMLVLETDLEYLTRGIRRQSSSVGRGRSLLAVRNDFEKEVKSIVSSSRDVEMLRQAKELIRLGMHQKARDLLGTLAPDGPVDVALGREAAVMEQFLTLHDSVCQVDEQRLASRQALERLWAQCSWDELLAPAGPVCYVPVDLSGVKDVALWPVAVEPPVSPANAAIAKALRKRIPKVKFRATRFCDAIQWFRDTTGGNIVPRWARLEAHGVDRSTPIDLELSNIATETALQQTLDLAGGAVSLRLIVKNGIVSIIPGDDYSCHVITRMYDARNVLEYLRLYNSSDDRARRSDSRDSGGDLFGGGGDLFDGGGTGGSTASGAFGQGGSTGGGGTDLFGAGSPGGSWAPAERGESFGTTRIDSGRRFVPPSFVGPDMSLRRAGGYRRHNSGVAELLSWVRGIEPETWVEYGGTIGSVREFGGWIVITSTVNVHKRWVAMFNLLCAKLRGSGRLPLKQVKAAAVLAPESLYSVDGRIVPWVAELLAKARAGKLSRFSSVKVAKVGARKFARIAGVWFDLSLGELCKIRSVARGAAAEIVLRKSDSTLAKCFALGEYVIVRVDDRSAVCIDTVGITDADDPAIRKIIKSLSS